MGKAMKAKMVATAATTMADMQSQRLAPAMTAMKAKWVAAPTVKVIKAERVAAVAPATKATNVKKAAAAERTTRAMQAKRVAAEALPMKAMSSKRVAAAPRMKDMM